MIGLNEYIMWVIVVQGARSVRPGVKVNENRELASTVLQILKLYW